MREGHVGEGGRRVLYIGCWLENGDGEILPRSLARNRFVLLEVDSEPETELLAWAILHLSSNRCCCENVVDGPSFLQVPMWNHIDEP